VDGLDVCDSVLFPIKTQIVISVMYYWRWSKLIITGTFIKLLLDATSEFHTLCGEIRGRLVNLCPLRCMQREVKLLFCFPLNISHCDRGVDV